VSLILPKLVTGDYITGLNVDWSFFGSMSSAALSHTPSVTLQPLSPADGYL
jgi:hypothetical protein